MGSVRIQKTHHTFIHNYPLQPLREQVLKIDSCFDMLVNRSLNIIPAERKIQLATLRYEKEHLKSLIQQIHPDICSEKTNRTKRGLFNAVGSVFKFVSGNLDASDGEKFDRAIEELKTNQENLISQYNKQFSINHKLIERYNELFQNISFDMDVVHSLVKTVKDERMMQTIALFKLNLSQLRNLVLNLHTALSFAHLNVLHMSIISENQIVAMKTELSKFNEPSSYYSLDNILFTRTISVDYYITSEHIVFLLHVPILNNEIFNLYHLYSVPTVQNSIIIPPTPYVAMHESSIFYLKNRCKYIQEQFFCSELNVEKNFQQDTCIKHLLQVKQSPKCRLVPVNITDSLVETINDEKYLLILPNETLVHEKCGNEEVHRLKGIYLITVPYSCSFITKDFKYINLKDNLPEEPVYLPPLDEDIAKIKPINLNLKSINLDELAKLTLQPVDPISYIHTNTHVWTHSSIPVYCLIFVLLIFFISIRKRKELKSFFELKCKNKQQSEPVPSEAVPLPTRRQNV